MANSTPNKPRTILIRYFYKKGGKSENLTLADTSVRVPTGLSPVILSDHPSDRSVINHAGCFDILRKETVFEMLKQHSHPIEKLTNFKC